MSAAPGVPWTEHRTPEGRPYWYHTIDRRSVWEKPFELKTPRERALEATPWKEYKSGDRSYYVHSVTKQSTWTLPPELKHVLDTYPLDGPGVGPASAAAPSHVQSPSNFARSPAASAVAAASTAIPSPVPSNLGVGAVSPAARALSPNHNMHPHIASGSNTPLAASPALSTPAAHHRGAAPTLSTIQTMSGASEVNFKGDKEAAESAFLQLLSDTGVDVDWTWEATMRAIITNPLYKALKTIAERKAAFHKHIDSLRKQRAAESAARLEQLKPAFKQLVAKDPRLKSYSSFATAKKFLGESAVWKRTKGDDEARQIYEAVIKDVKQLESESEAKIRKRNMEMLMALLKTFEADVFTRWRDAHRTILESQEYIDDPHLPSMDLTDMLVVFEDLMKDIEREADSAKRKQAEARRRKERQNRDAFKALLTTLQAEGKIKARTTWGEIFPLVQDHDALKNCLGQRGSTPLEMFFDFVDDLDQILEKQTADALQSIDKVGQKVTSTTTEEEFLTWTSASEACREIPESTLKQIFTELVDYLAEEEQKKLVEERRKFERKYRNQIEDLRYAFKKLSPPLALDSDSNSDPDTWEKDVRPRIQHLPEYKEAMELDERIPKSAWEKFVRRQKEKLAESFTNGDTSRKRKHLPESNTTVNNNNIDDNNHDDDDDQEAARSTTTARTSTRRRRSSTDSTSAPTVESKRFRKDSTDNQHHYSNSHGDDDDSEPEEGEV